MVPVVALCVIALQGSWGEWARLMSGAVPAMLHDTVILLAGVFALVCVVGAGTAWLVTAYDFPGRRLFSWALILPLAIPTYIAAFVYADVLHPVATFQSALRAILGFSSPREFSLPEVRSLGGCILLFGFVLFPYVYIAARAVFLVQSASMAEVSRSLGVSRSETLRRVILPLARPAIVAGALLALLEALNDIGAADTFGVRTVSVSIYSTWINSSSLPGAAQLAITVLAVIGFIVGLERYARRSKRFCGCTNRSRPANRMALKGWRASAALAAVSAPVAIGFVIPAGYLVVESVKRLRFKGLSADIINQAFTTAALATAATLLVLALGAALAYAMRLTRSGNIRGVLRTGGLGYAIPGTVVAIGLLTPIAFADNALASVVEALSGMSPGLLISGSGLGLIYAYAVRFLTVSCSNVEAGYSHVSPSLDAASRVLGRSASGTFFQVHLTLLRPAMAGAAILVFVDCMKELSATLLLRPLNIETLATHVYGEAARGTYEDGAVAALLIVAISLIPVVLLARVGNRLAKPLEATPAPSHTQVLEPVLAPQPLPSGLVPA
jgi:iron(III) transport system permease protein